MLPEEFLNEHQKIVKQLLEGKPNLPRMERLHDQLDARINAYCDAADKLKRLMENFNRDARDLYQLRDVIKKVLTDAKGENIVSD